MKAKRTKKDSWMSIKIDSSLRRQIEGLAYKECRTMTDQARFLLEKGLAAVGQGAAARQPESDKGKATA
ncbi:MAG: hypothetical protein LBI06_05745 [Treponema sp.]|jgi:hypothetical protein|nr:hypothetical protein [Treponema sp.]